MADQTLLSSSGLLPVSFSTPVMHEISSYGLALISLGAIGFGVYLLVLGGGWAIDSAVWIAERSGLTKMFIGATIVAFGTSAPELVTSVNANMSGYPGISLGNVIGSNIANFLFVLGVAALIAPVTFARKEVWVDTWMMLGATAALTYGVHAGMIGSSMGALMFGALLVYVVFQYFQSKKAAALGDGTADGGDDEDSPDISGAWQASGMLIGGLVALTLGSEILVQGAIAGGMALGVREAVIGMTVVALGTSLPELGACIAAARKKQTDIIIGGLVGSAIFNILSILGITSMLKDLPIDPAFLRVDLWAVIAVTLVVSAALLLLKSFQRWAGAVFVAAYLAFMAYQFLS